MKKSVGWGLALLVASLGAFLALAEDLVTHDPLTLFDVRLAQWWVDHRVPALTPVVVFFTDLHSPISMTAASLALAGMLAVQKQFRWLATLAAAMGGGAILNYTLKLAFGRARPDVVHEQLVFEGYSFPSGHVAGATLFYGFLLAYAWRRMESGTARCVALAAVLLIDGLVAVSRMYLGAHFLSDVLAALAEAAAWLTLCLMVSWRRFPR